MPWEGINIPTSHGPYGHHISSFPCKVRWHDFRIDPYEPSRVWFTARAMGTCLGFCYFLLQKTQGGVPFLFGGDALMYT